VDLANSERQAIWTRQATMLVANSILVNVAHDPAKTASGDALFLNVAGLALCLVWLAMICNGYSWFWDSMTKGKALPVVDPSLNPFAGMKDISAWWKDVLFLCAVAVPGRLCVSRGAAASLPFVSYTGKNVLWYIGSAKSSHC
jgi:hypothetical protein